MKKLLKNITVFGAIFVMLFGMLENVQAQENRSNLSATGVTMPVEQVIVYQPQTVSYDNFSAAIFSQGKIAEASKLSPGSEVSLYVDVNKLNGPVGLETGVRCSDTQASTAYYDNTITMDKRFCADFNDAILDGKTVYGMVPTEDIFIHKASGERCFQLGNGGAFYMINPTSPFIRNYIVNRSGEKLSQYGVTTLFMDNLRAGWSALTDRCGGNPLEYPNLNDYAPQMLDMARYITTNLPGYHIQGNLGSASVTAWDNFSFLDGAMCENCFSDWTRAWPTAAEMLTDLTVVDKWVQSGHKLYLINQAPDTTEASNRFAFASALLAARADGKNLYFHFSADYKQFYAIPEYQYALGAPLAAHVCNGNICTRQFEYGTVNVDFGTRTGTITMNAVSAATLVPATATATQTAAPITFTATVVPPTIAPTQTLAPATITATVVPPTATPTQIVPPTAAPVTLYKADVRVASGKDDVEENSAGSMYIDSTDLELIYDASVQTVGIRFTGVKIPKGAVITQAYIQFKVDETSSTTLSLKIQGQASANAPAFASTAKNVSLRARTIKSVSWSPAAWSKVGEMGTNQRTPNLTPVVQEIVSKSGWASGNSLVIIITGTSGKRVAEAFEGDAAGAPLLHIEYTMP